MRRSIVWLGAAGGVFLLLLVVVALLFLPRLIYPPLAPSGRAAMALDKWIELQQAQGELQSGLRGQLLQGFGGLFVIAGALAAWYQLRIARESQITVSFTAAIEHLGSDKLDVRLGGIYALERVARNSASSTSSVEAILAAFIRGRAPWNVDAADEHPTTSVATQIAWLSHRAPDVQDALTVLGRRPRSRPDEPRLFLSRVDLRRADLSGAHLSRAYLRHANLASGWLERIHLERGNLVDIDLRSAYLQGALLAQADLRDAHLQNADLRHAVLHGADLRGADLSGALLEGADFANVTSDQRTRWPDGYGADEKLSP